MGVIDESYCGDNDQWFMPVLAIRDTEIHVNDPYMPVPYYGTPASYLI